MWRNLPAATEHRRVAPAVSSVNCVIGSSTLACDKSALRNLQICTVCGAVVGYDTGLFTLMCSDQTRVWFGLDS